MRRLVQKYDYMRARSAARSMARRRNWSEAISLYERLVEMPGSVAADRIQLGHAYKETGEQARANRCYRSAVEMEPLRADAHRQLGHSLIRSGQEEEGILCLARLLLLDPTDAFARSYLADNRLHGEKLDRLMTKAGEQLNGYLGATGEGKPGWAFFIKRGRARRAARRRKWAKAAKIYQKLRRSHPLDVNLLVNHGHALKGQGHLDEAEALYRRAMILKPEDADLTVQMGQVYKLRGQFSLARRAFRKAQVIGGEVGTKELAELDRFERERDIARSNELARVSNLQTPRALSPDARGIYLRLGHLTSVTEKDRTKGRH